MTFKIGRNCQIASSAIINAKDGYIGDGAIIREGAIIEGNLIEIGREAFIDRGACIGGGSAFDPDASLKAGDWLHMGVNSHINIARGVKIGHEFGCGIETKVFTHGAYIDSYNLGAPTQWEGVDIGDSVWLPNAWVNPGTKIGSNVVVAARSLINKDLPSGCLAGGVPIKILKENYLPKDQSLETLHNLVEGIVLHAQKRFAIIGSAKKITWSLEDHELKTEDSIFNLKLKTIKGPTTAWTKILKDQLRRNGIRFRFKEGPQEWLPWSISSWEI